MAMTYITSQDNDSHRVPFLTTQISVKAKRRCCLFPFLQAPLISVFSILVSKSQYGLPIAFMISLILSIHTCPQSHHLHRLKILTLFGVSLHQVLSVALLLVSVIFLTQ